jgi:hypothetical protein
MDARLSFRISSRSFAFIVDDTLYDVMFSKIGTSCILLHPFAANVLRLGCTAL